MKLLTKPDDFQPTVPVLFLAFNRPEETARVFEAIRQAAPPRLFVAVDGPRPDRPADQEDVARVREVVSRVDWDCRVETLFREENLGCGRAVSGALDWFFSRVPEGIVVEDDCLPSQSFFWYCQTLLEHYRHDHRVMSVSGNSLTAEVLDIETSVFFSPFAAIWGWATWKRAWDLYDFSMSSFPDFQDQGQMKNFVDHPAVGRHWMKSFKETWAGGYDTWDFQWIYTVLSQGGLCAISRENLVTNIGHFDGTHYQEFLPKWHGRPAVEMDEIVLPDFVVRQRDAEAQIQRFFCVDYKTDLEFLNRLDSPDPTDAFWFDLGDRLPALHPENLTALPQNARIYIYGFGQTGFELRDLLATKRPDVSILGWVDTYKKNGQGDPDLINVDSLKNRDFDFVVIASKEYTRDIFLQLRDRDISPHLVFADFQAHVLEWLERNRLRRATPENYALNRAMLRAVQRSMGLDNWADHVVSGEAAMVQQVLAGKDAPLVLDVGGHHGEYARLVRTVCPGAVVHSFEPHPDSFARLSREADRLGFAAHRLGCSDTPGPIRLYDYPENPGSVHASLYPETFRQLYGCEPAGFTAQAVRLDDFLDEAGIGVVDLLKIDAEGHDLAVLQGAARAIAAGRVSAVHFEFGAAHALARVFLRDFKDALPGYRFHRLLPEGMAELGGYVPWEWELFDYQNILALRED